MKSSKPNSTAASRSRRARPANRCEYCGEPLVAELVNVYRHRGPRHVLFQDVPALVCRGCGHREFEADAVDNMEHRLNHPTGRGKKAEILVIPA